MIELSRICIFYFKIYYTGKDTDVDIVDFPETRNNEKIQEVVNFSEQTISLADTSLKGMFADVNLLSSSYKFY